MASFCMECGTLFHDNDKHVCKEKDKVKEGKPKTLLRENA